MSCTQEWRKCHICGDEVLWQTNGIGWHPIQYHDCKPVPRARLEQAERERDEARAERDSLRAHPAMAADGQILARLGEATALLAHARKIITDAHPAGGGDLYAYFVVKAIDSLLDEQPEPEPGQAQRHAERLERMREREADGGKPVTMGDAEAASKSVMDALERARKEEG